MASNPPPVGQGRKMSTDANVFRRPPRERRPSEAPTANAKFGAVGRSGEAAPWAKFARAGDASHRPGGRRTLERRMASRRDPPQRIASGPAGLSDSSAPHGSQPPPEFRFALDVRARRAAARPRCQDLDVRARSFAALPSHQRAGAAAAVAQSRGATAAAGSRRIGALVRPAARLAAFRGRRLRGRARNAAHAARAGSRRLHACRGQRGERGGPQAGRRGARVLAAERRPHPRRARPHERVPRPAARAPPARRRARDRRGGGGARAWRRGIRNRGRSRPAASRRAWFAAPAR